MVKCQLLLVMVIIPLYSSDEADVLFGELATSDVTFSFAIENIYKEHTLSLLYAARRYELKNKKSSSITAMHHAIASTKLSDLLKLAHVELKELCDQDDVREAFNLAYHQNQSAVPLYRRVAGWKEFVVELYDNRRSVISKKLPEVWFPDGKHQTTDYEFIEQNAEVVLDQSGQKYVIAYTLATFLPFALMHECDQEVFATFLAAR